MKVLYCGLGDDYGDPARGPSYEQMNFQTCLGAMPDVEMMHYDIGREILEHGYWGANRLLTDMVEDSKPDVLFMVMFEEQVDRDVIERISRGTKTVTVGWFCDDHWRFEGYSRHWARALDLIVTTDVAAERKYHDLGYRNVLRSQWGFNHYSYEVKPRPPVHGVTFVGQPHGNRKRTIATLERHGVKVETWGGGWPNGRISHDQMVDVFSSSLVNLNLAASSTGGLFGSGPPQIKGRLFEVTGCGGLLLTEYVTGLEDYFEIGSEIVVYRGLRDLTAKCRMLITSPSLCREIGERSRQRVMREHTMEHRLTDVLRAARNVRK